MADQMTARLSTFAETSEKMAKIDQQQAAAQTTTAAADATTQTQQDNTQQQAATQTADTTQQQQESNTTTEQKPANTDSSDFNLSLGDEAADTTTTTQQTVQQPVFNLDEELKKADPKEIAKKLGISEFALEMDQHIRSGGQPVDYLNARAIDYNQVSDDALVKQDLKNKNPKLDGRQVDLLFNRKYNVPEDATDEDKELAQIQLQTDAYNLRQAKIAEQQKFKISDTPIHQKDEAYEQWKIDKDNAAQQFEQANNYYLSHAATKALNESKRVTLNLGEGIAPFNFVIDKPDMITKAFTDDGSIWRKLTSTPQGEPDVAKQQLIALFTYNPQKFIQDVFKYGQSHGLKEIVEEGQNAQKPQAKVAAMTNTSGKIVPTGIGKFGGGAK